MQIRLVSSICLQPQCQTGFWVTVSLPPPVQRRKSRLQSLPCILGALVIKGCHIEEEIEAVNIAADNFVALGSFPNHAFNHIGHDFAADAFHGNRWHGAGVNQTARQFKSFVTHDDFAGLGDGLQTGRKIRLGTDDGVVHAVFAAEVADVAITGVEAHAGFERMFDAAASPDAVQMFEAVFHGKGHAEASLGVFLNAFGFGITEENQNGITDELVDGAAVFLGNLSHVGKVFIKQRGQVFGLKPLGGGGKILDVGEKDGELLAFGGDGHIALAAEDAFVDLRRNVFLQF